MKPQTKKSLKQERIEKEEKRRKINDCSTKING